jgi:hypothetical protein
MPTATIPTMTVSINHLSDLPLYENVKPYEIVLPILPAGVPQSNFHFTSHKIDLHDIRNGETDFGLETTGFEPIYHKSQCLPAFKDLDASDEKAIEVAAPYLDETGRLAQDKLRAEKVVIMDWKYREHQPAKNTENIAFVYKDYIEARQGRKIDNVDENLPPDTWIPRFKGPSSHQIAHSDFSFDSGMETVQRFFTPSESKQFCTPQYRIRIMNIWRPLIPEIASAPLAYCDRRTTKREDIMPYDRVMPDRVAENGHILHREEHKWYWLSRQTPEEPMAFMVWDSDDYGGNVSQKTPGLVAHGAFENPMAIGAPPRRSMEVQMIIVTKREE